MEAYSGKTGLFIYIITSPTATLQGCPGISRKEECSHRGSSQCKGPEAERAWSVRGSPRKTAWLECTEEATKVGDKVPPPTWIPGLSLPRLAGTRTSATGTSPLSPTGTQPAALPWTGGTWVTAPRGIWTHSTMAKNSAAAAKRSIGQSVKTSCNDRVSCAIMALGTVEKPSLSCRHLSQHCLAFRLKEAPGFM
ncbi:sodium/potassium-transporting ATPase subunit gamma isoform X5 [Desmodus rotundus]|uniref:sodium/potassium-transporting ATPase subunit gamma isoform X5 n=1 Tax=Desmodus rotundus TaxID=9430 RepID=UPI0023811316|nr:sodium/potassium-transporting ATPase subunit gamma isoform X5 [Desmodus rotundus]